MAKLNGGLSQVELLTAAESELFNCGITTILLQYKNKVLTKAESLSAALILLLCLQTCISLIPYSLDNCRE